MPELQDRIAAVIDREIDGVWETLDVAIALIEALGLKPQVEKSGVGCDQCEPITLTRWVTDWEVIE